jgi:hypothetical protein
MAEFVYLKPFVSVDGTDISAFVQSATFDEPQDVVEWIASNPGSGLTYKSRLAAVQDASLDLELSDDLTATTGLNAIIRGCRGRVVTVIWAPNGSSYSASNLKHSMSAVYDHNSQGGAVGQQAKKSVKFMNATTAGVTVTSS